MRNKSNVARWVAKTGGYHKLLLSLFLALCCYATITFFHITTLTKVIISWDTFAIAMIAMFWILFFTTNAGEQKEIVRKQDDDIKIIFVIILTSVLICFTGTLFLILNSQESVFDKEVRTAATLTAITTSWILLHTIFTIRYAHLYLNYNRSKPETVTGDGIDFPNSEGPDYMDFAYFSFVIGMTFQVSDVTISSRIIRRYVLMHSLISFVFNTIIVALTVNVIASMSK